MQAQDTPPQKNPTACLALADGTLFFGHGFGAVGDVVAELVFNTAMTGYQEIMTDPSPMRVRSSPSPSPISAIPA